MDIRRILTALLLLALLAPMACEREGPAERTGEQLDEAAEQTGERLEEAGEEVEEGAEK